MPQLHPSLQVILRTLSAALEHTPSETRAILSNVVQPHVDTVCKLLPAPAAPAAPDQAEPA